MYVQYLLCVVVFLLGYVRSIEGVINLVSTLYLVDSILNYDVDQKDHIPFFELSMLPREGFSWYRGFLMYSI